MKLAYILAQQYNECTDSPDSCAATSTIPYNILIPIVIILVLSVVIYALIIHKDKDFKEYEAKRKWERTNGNLDND